MRMAFSPRRTKRPSEFQVRTPATFADALMVMVLPVIYLLLTRRHSHWGEPESVGTMAALQTHKK